MLLGEQKTLLKLVFDFVLLITRVVRVSVAGKELTAGGNSFWKGVNAPWRAMANGPLADTYMCTAELRGEGLQAW